MRHTSMMTHVATSHLSDFADGLPSMLDPDNDSRTRNPAAHRDEGNNADDTVVSRAAASRAATVWTARFHNRTKRAARHAADDADKDYTTGTAPSTARLPPSDAPASPSTPGPCATAPELSRRWGPPTPPTLLRSPTPRSRAPLGDSSVHNTPSKNRHAEPSRRTPANGSPSRARSASRALTPVPAAGPSKPAADAALEAAGVQPLSAASADKADRKRKWRAETDAAKRQRCDGALFSIAESVSALTEDRKREAEETRTHREAQLDVSRSLLQTMQLAVESNARQFNRLVDVMAARRD
jgi:hypothetical protein